MRRLGPTKARAHGGGRSPAVRFGALTAILAATTLLSGCRDGLTVDDLTAAELNDPQKRHPIGFTTRGEALFVEMGGKGEGLSANQRADVVRFVNGYKGESRGRLRVAAPGSVRGHLAVSRSVREVIDVVREAGVPERYVDIVRRSSYAEDGFGPAIELSYEREVAVAPVCGQWPENMVDNRERIPYENFGCATQRNLAITVANGRDLQGPQAETPRSSERRSVTWTKYVKGDGVEALDPALDPGGSSNDPGAGSGNQNGGRPGRM